MHDYLLVHRGKVSKWIRRVPNGLLIRAPLESWFDATTTESWNQIIVDFGREIASIFLPS